MADIALNLGNILFFFLRNNIDTCGRGVGAMTLSPSSAAPRTLLVVLVFLINLALIGLAPIGGVSSRHISKGKISKPSLSGVFLLFF